MNDDVLALLRDRNPVPIEPPAPPIEVLLARRDWQEARSGTDTSRDTAERPRRLPRTFVPAAAMAVSLALVVLVGFVVLSGHGRPTATNTGAGHPTTGPVVRPLRSRLRGGGDPAADVLLGRNVFYPYAPRISSVLEARLNALTIAAANAHFPIKVALIASKFDLGTAAQLLGRPQAYARYLDLEISLHRSRSLIVVMRNGYGVRGLTAAATAAAATLPLPRGDTSNDLAQAAIHAIETLAAAAGHPLHAPAGSPSQSQAPPGLAGAKPIAQITLRSPAPSITTSGTVDEVVRNGQYGIVVHASGLAANTRHNAYAVWLYTSGSPSKLLGFVSPGVTADGHLTTAGPLPKNASKYDEILITLETNSNPRAPGRIVLAGKATFR
jgi:hypothetical protein